MWTPATRGRMAEIEKKTKRLARTDLREVLNAIRYLVYWWFRRFVRRFLFQTTIEIIKRSDTARGFEVLPRRWVVERTFGWMTRWRRLVRQISSARPSRPLCAQRRI